MIRLSKSTITNAEKVSVSNVLDKEYLGMGDEVNKFENLLSDFIGSPAICVSNGTAALQLACQAVGIGLGDKVLVQSLTYVASFQAISATGATPVACDIKENTLTLNCIDAESRITPNTKAIMPVHYAGGVGDIDEIYQLAKRHNLRVIEDAAHAFGTEYRGKKIGCFGDIVCFSFDGIKNITSGEGGCVVTKDKKVLQKVRDARLLGVEKDTEKRFSGDRSWDFNVTSQGWRYHMSNIMAAIGIVQLERFPLLSVKRQDIYKIYNSIFHNHNQIKSIELDIENVIPHIYVVRIKGLKNRELLQKKMLELGIQTGYHYQPNHLLDFYRVRNENTLLVTDAIFPELLSLPLHPDLTKSDVHKVATSLIRLIANENL